MNSIKCARRPGTVARMSAVLAVRTNGLGCWLSSTMQSSMAVNGSETLWNTPRRTLPQIRSQMKRPILLSQDASAGVNSKWKRSCRLNLAGRITNIQLAYRLRHGFIAAASMKSARMVSVICERMTLNARSSGDWRIISRAIQGRKVKSPRRASLLGTKLPDQEVGQPRSGPPPSRPATLTRPRCWSWRRQFGQGERSDIWWYGYQPYGQQGLLIADIDVAAATGLLAARCKPI